MSDIEKMMSSISAIARYTKTNLVNLSSHRHIVKRVASLVEYSTDERISVTVAIARNDSEPTIVLADMAPGAAENRKSGAYQIDLIQQPTLLKEIYEVIVGDFYQSIHKEVAEKYQSTITLEAVTKIAAILRGEIDE